MIEIVPMGKTHIADVAALERACFSCPWSEKSLTEELSNPLACWLVALVDGAFAGYVGSQAVLGEADMMNLAVQPEYRRRGIGEKLVSSLVDALKARGDYQLTLEVRPSNVAACRLYAGLGFDPVGLRKNYYREPKEDGLILRKEWVL